jgi:nitric oxide dioxygenase
MTTRLSERNRSIVIDTLPLIEQHRSQLEEALSRYMARQGPHDGSIGGSKAKTAAIVEMLIHHVAELDGNGQPAGTAATAQGHRDLGIRGEHYSSLGDGLKPVMKDVLGAAATAPVLAAWGDAYWAIVRMLFSRQVQLAA